MLPDNAPSDASQAWTPILTSVIALLVQMKRSGQAPTTGVQACLCYSCCIRQSMRSLAPTARTWSAAPSTTIPTQHTSASGRQLTQKLRVSAQAQDCSLRLNDVERCHVEHHELLFQKCMLRV